MTITRRCAKSLEAWEHGIDSYLGVKARSWCSRRCRCRRVFDERNFLVNRRGRLAGCVVPAGARFSCSGPLL